MKFNLEFKGFERYNGRPGARNYVLILPTVSCSLGLSEVALKKIAEEIGEKKVKLLKNLHGCGQVGEDLEQTTRTLTNTALNPNVYSTIVVSLGCESVDAEKVADSISATKPTELIRIQDLGYSKALDKIKELAKKFSSEASLVKKSSFDASQLVVGLECGGSDFTSGIVSNPLVGRISDMIVSLGGSTIISEVPEFIGAEHIYAKRAINDNIRKQAIDTVRSFEEWLKREANVDFRGAQPSPGNIAGGLTTIEEKSLGAIKKSGSSPVSGVLKYAERLGERNGHYLMITPGYDIVSVSGMVAGGAQIVLFTTGRGTPTGHAIAPVIKITANADTYKIMQEFIDYDVSPILNGNKTFENATQELLKIISKTASGELTKAEILNQDDFGIFRIGPTF
ncbi:MAG: UxaA family hydrolase [Caldisphaera sp.]|jgi:altronate dehydratase large subunit